MVLGGMVHSLYGALGVGFFAKLIPVLFTPLAIAGSIYMAWIGLTLIRSAIVIEGVACSDATTNWEAFRRGAVTCLLNPKAYLFMLSVYPQFLKQEFGPLAPQAAVMAATMAVIQLGVYGTLALAAGRAHGWINNSTATVWAGRVCGTLLIAISALTLMEAMVG